MTPENKQPDGRTYLNELGLSTRARKAIHMVFYPLVSRDVTLADLATKKTTDLTALKNCGDSTIAELRAALRRAGLHFLNERPTMPRGQRVGNHLDMVVKLIDTVDPPTAVEVKQGDNWLMLHVTDRRGRNEIGVQMIRHAGFLVVEVTGNKSDVLFSKTFALEKPHGSEEDGKDGLEEDGPTAGLVRNEERPAQAS